jgi:hypothetical protein
MGARGLCLPELAGLPDWRLMPTEAAAAACICREPSAFARGVGSGDLPLPRRTPGAFVLVQVWERPGR